MYSRARIASEGERAFQGGRKSSIGGRCRRLVTGLTVGLGSLMAATAVQAQCTENFEVVLRVPDGTMAGAAVPAAVVAPLGNGSSLSSLIATINTVNTSFATQTSAFISGHSTTEGQRTAYGAWGRAIGGKSETENTSVARLDVSGIQGTLPNGISLPVVDGAQTCNTTVETRYAGAQFGFDLANVNLDSGGSLYFGVTGGIIVASSSDKTPGISYLNSGTALTNPAGELDSDTEVPFFGVYAAYTEGNFFVDGQMRADFYKSDLSDPLSGLSGDTLDAQGISLAANAGYQVQLGSNWVLSPSVGVTWSHVKVDDLRVPGIPETDVVPAATSGGRLGVGVVSTDDIESLLGRASLQLVTVIPDEQVTFQPFAIASIFHEFAGDAEATSVVNGTGNANLDGARLNTTIDRIGTYAQFGLGTGFAFANSGWRGFVRGDYRIGDQIEGWGVSGGLRYNFDSALSGG